MNNNFDEQVQANGDLLILHFGTPVIRIRVNKDRTKFDGYKIGDRTKWIASSEDLDHIKTICKKTIHEKYKEKGF
tara:strand:+ start:295 stop:519 length:225 start_codon:yes stop_codon:yes gene_type:complete